MIKFIIDDVSIGLTLSKTLKLHKIKRYNFQGTFDIKTFEFNKSTIINSNDLFLYRCKTSNKHSNTIDIMNELLKLFYNIN